MADTRTCLSWWWLSRRGRLAVALFVAAAVAFPVAARVQAAGIGPQVFKTPSGQAENVRVERSPGEVISVSYDLVSGDPRAVFVVALRVSRDGGKTFDLQPKSVSGDVGSGVRAGTGKKIVWQAGRDVESVEMDLFRFSIRLEAANASPVAAAPEAKPAAAGARPAAPATEPKPTTARAPAPAPKTGSLEVKSTPAGAAIKVDGQARGVTPVTLKDVAPGEHSVTLARDGYLENARTVTVEAGKTARLAAELTPAPKPAASTTSAETPKKGSPLKWLLPVAGGAGAVGILAASKGKGGGSSSGNVTPPPTYTDGLVITSVVPASGSVIRSGSSTIMPGTGLISISASLSTSKALPRGNLEIYLLSNNQSRTSCGVNTPETKVWQNLPAGQLTTTVTGFQMGPFPCTVTGILAMFTTYSSYVRFSPPPAGDSQTIVEVLMPMSWVVQ